MKNILLLAFTFVSVITFGQITITQTDLPQAGQEYYRSSANGIGFDVTETGSNYTWDYSDLERTQRDTFIYELVSNTPIFYQFMFNNPISPSYKATEAKLTDDIDLAGFISMTNNYLFSQQSSSSWTEVGIGTTISGVPLPTKYSDIKTKLNVPLNYEDYNSDDYSYLIQIPTIGATGQDGNLTYEVDGWGTIMLPGGTYDALRVKTSITKSDTIYIDLLGFGLRIPSDETIYEWYAKGEGYPVLTVTTTLFDVVSGIEFSDNLINSISNKTLVEANSVYPNPVQNTLFFTLNQNDLEVSIIDITGSLVYSSTELSPKQINVNFLPQGTYFVTVDNSSTHEILKFIKH